MKLTNQTYRDNVKHKPSDAERNMGDWQNNWISRNQELIVELSDEVLETIAGGLNPQPEPPRILGSDEHLDVVKPTKLKASQLLFS